jgi:hypothetical protein
MIDWQKVAQDLERENAELKKQLEHKMQYVVEIEDVSKLVAGELRDCQSALWQDFERVLETRQGFVYSSDWHEDCKQILKRINAIELILEDYEV